jgi:hypothetical protein
MGRHHSDYSYIIVLSCGARIASEFEAYSREDSGIKFHEVSHWEVLPRARLGHMGARGCPFKLMVQ